MRKSRLSWYKQERLIEHFVAGTTARIAALLVDVNKTTTASYYFHRLRLLIYERYDRSDLFAGEIEVDESYFGGRRKGKRGRGAADKQAVFGLLKRNNRVFAEIISDAKTNTLLPSNHRYYCVMSQLAPSTQQQESSCSKRYNE